MSSRPRLRGRIDLNLGLRSSGPVTFTVSFGHLREGCLPSTGLLGSSLGGRVSAAPLCGGTLRKPARSQADQQQLRYVFGVDSVRLYGRQRHVWNTHATEFDPSSLAFQLEWLTRHVSLDLSLLERVCQCSMRALGGKELSFENCLAQHSRIPVIISLAPRFLLPFG